MNIFLLGYMGSGKTTIGKRLARYCNLTFVDMDTLFEFTYKLTISDFFEKYNEQAFRIIESKLLIEVSIRDNQIIATGGGTPCFYENMNMILTSGKSIYLKASPIVLTRRILSNQTKRPLVSGLDETQLLAKIIKQLTEREQFYSKADYTIDTETLNFTDLEQLINSIVKD
jgi:shikimate kinase